MIASMNVYILWFLSILPVILMYEQSQFVVKFNRMELIRYNKTMCQLMKIATYKYNRTQAVVNTTIHTKPGYTLGNDLEMEMQVYKFLSNEYRLFPLRLSFNFCEMVMKNEFGLGNMFHCGNIKKCPLPSRIFMCNWAPDSARFPPLIPGGDYMQEVRYLYRSTELAVTHGFAEVKYPECKGCIM